MECKHHPNRQADHLCTICGVPMCKNCSQVVTGDRDYCFHCAMFDSILTADNSGRDEGAEPAEQTLRENRKWSPFQYFSIVSSLLLLIMWIVVVFGGSTCERVP